MSSEFEPSEGQIKGRATVEEAASRLTEPVLIDTPLSSLAVDLQEGEGYLAISPELIERRIRTVSNLDRYIASHRSSGRTRVLRDKQMAVFIDTRNFINEGNTEGFVEAPTGFGKTVLFSEFIKATNEKTVIAVPTRLLVEQTYARLRQFNPNMDIGRFYSDIKERGRQITVTTYQSLVLSNGGANPEEIDLLVLDEVHQSLTDMRIEAANRFRRSIKLGFTATPEYTNDKRVQNLLNNEIHTITLKEAVETGLLSSFSVYLAETDVDISNINVTKHGDYDQKELEEAVNIYSRNKSATELYKQLVAQNPDLAKSVVYCVSIRHAREVAALFNAEGIPAAAVWSNQDRNERKAVMDAYRKGEIKVLTNVNILTEGFDDPEAALCLNLRPTLSRVVAKQRGGRVLRLDPENRHKHAIIVDYLDRNENKRNAQVTFAHVAEGTEIRTQTTIDTSTGVVGPNVGNGGGVYVDTAPQFNIDGLNVITSAEEVLKIIREIEEEKYDVAPEGWMVLGQIGIPFTVADLVGKSQGWVERQIRRIIDTVQNEQEEQRVPIELREQLIGDFLRSSGNIRTHYSPTIIRRLMDVVNLDQGLEHAPVGWFSKNKLAKLLGRSDRWVGAYLVNVLEELEVEQSEKGKHIREYKSRGGKAYIYYSPDVKERLDGLSKSIKDIPEGWMTIGNHHTPNSIRFIIKKSHYWVKKNIIDILCEIDREQEEKGIPVEDRTNHCFNLETKKTNSSITYYSPIVIDRLRKSVEKLQNAPEGWMIIGGEKQKGTEKTLVSSLGKGKNWVRKRLPEVLLQLDKEQEEQGLPSDKRKQYYQECVGKTMILAMYYAPEVRAKLEELSGKEEEDLMKVDYQ